MVANFRRGRIVQGASTITQQFVRANVLDRIAHLRPQVPRSLALASPRREVRQEGDPAGLPEPRVFRRGLLRRAGRFARLLRQARLRHYRRRRRDAGSADQPAVRLDHSQDAGTHSRSPRLGAARNVCSRLPGRRDLRHVDRDAGRHDAGQRRAARRRWIRSAPPRARTSRAWCTKRCSSSSASSAR